MAAGVAKVKTPFLPDIQSSLSSSISLSQQRPGSGRSNSSSTNIGSLPKIPSQTNTARIGLETIESTVSARSKASIQYTNLPIVKCQAFISIFEDAYEQLAVLSDIAPVEASRVGGKKSLENEIAQIIKDQKHLELRYNEILQEQEAIRSAQQGAAGKKAETQRNRTVKKFSSHAQNVSKINAERTSLLTLFGKTIRELRDGRFDSLVFTVEEEYRKKDLLQNTINREMESSVQLKNLQEQLKREKQLLEDETLERDQIVQQLKDTIQEIKVLTASEQKYLKKETRAHESSVKIQCDRKEMKLEKQKGHLFEEHQIEMKAHQAIMDFLAHQREELEQQIQDWMTKYEDDTERKGQEMESLKQKRAAELDMYEELVGKHQELEKIVEEDRQSRIRAEEARKLEELRNRKARQIQRWWAKIREKIKQSKGKKKGKGSGKKK